MKKGAKKQMSEMERFQRFFGKRVCVQLKEAIAICVSSGEPVRVPVIDRHGNTLNKSGRPSDPSSGELAARSSWPISVSKDEAGQHEFSLLITDCVILPTEEGHLSIHYEYKGAMLELDVSPDIVLAVTTVSAVKEAPSVIGSA